MFDVFVLEHQEDYGFIGVTWYDHVSRSWWQPHHVYQHLTGRNAWSLAMPCWGDCPRNKLNTLTTEHALAILCMLRSPHRVSEQLRHCLLILRGLKSEEHLCTRAMVTAAELYTVVDKLLAKEIQSGVAAWLPFWGNKDPWATATCQEHQQLHISIAHLLLFAQERAIREQGSYYSSSFDGIA